MGSRFVSPHPTQFSKLRQPLEPGEQEVFELLDSELPQDWEIYVQPPLNGLCPDFVLVHPSVGIVVIEVKDWSFKGVDYFIEYGDDGQFPRLMGKRGGKTFFDASKNPFLKINTYRQEIIDLYCPSFSDETSAGNRVVFGTVVFTRAGRDQVTSLFEPFKKFLRCDKYPENCRVATMEDLESGDITKFVRYALLGTRGGMSAAIANDLRNWLIEPEYTAEQRRPLPLTKRQKDLVTGRTERGYRRIRGPAGSGKSLVLAGRAAQVCSERKKVLVVSFNITLLNYLKDLSVRWEVPPGCRPRTEIEWHNFHYLFKRICYESGKLLEYGAIWRDYFQGSETAHMSDTTLDKRIGELFDAALPLLKDRFKSYDAVLVDEGQDFHPPWWNSLRNMVKEDGEMMLVADRTQDLYGTAKAWTDGVMSNCGFVGPWTQLEESFRVHSQLQIKLRDFADRFLNNDDADLPTYTQEDIEPLSLKWIQTNEQDFCSRCCEEAIAMGFAKEPTYMSVPDVTIVVTSRKLGVAINSLLHEKKIKAIHTFYPNNRSRERSSKMVFYKGDARVKATTIHSFKGLETRALLICIEKGARGVSPHLVYTALSRLKKNINGSFLTVVSSEPELADYGNSWA